jgi:RimJ/RimL family protein N-acetyltransferase
MMIAAYADWLGRARFSAWATERKVCEISLGTIEAFKAAHRFYEKYGFRRFDKFDLPAAFPIMKGDTLFYRLVISK